MTGEEARALFARARERHAARDVAGSIELARAAVTLDPGYAEALEHLAMLLVTRRGAYDDGLACMERATAAHPDDAGQWYTLGWLEEFVAHETARAGGAAPVVRAHYECAAEAFRRCLALNPEGKLRGDAEDLIDHVENQLRG